MFIIKEMVGIGIRKLSLGIFIDEFFFSKADNKVNGVSPE